MPAPVDRQLGGLTVHLKMESSVTYVFLHIAGGRLHLQRLFILQQFHFYFKAQIFILGEIPQSNKPASLFRGQRTLRVTPKELILPFSKFNQFTHKPPNKAGTVPRVILKLPVETIKPSGRFDE